MTEAPTTAATPNPSGEEVADFATRIPKATAASDVVVSRTTLARS